MRQPLLPSDDECQMVVPKKFPWCGHTLSRQGSGGGGGGGDDAIHSEAGGVCWLMRVLETPEWGKRVRGR